MTYLHAKFQGQRSVDSEDRLETSGRMDGGECITSHASAVGNQNCGRIMNVPCMLEVGV